MAEKTPYIKLYFRWWALYQYTSGLKTIRS